MSFRTHLDDCSFDKLRVIPKDQLNDYEASVNRVDSDLTSSTSCLEERCENPQLSPSHGDQRPFKVEFISMENMDSNNTQHHEMEKDFKRIHGNGANSVRYKQTRMSLLGKPLNYRAHKRDIRYRRLQAKVYNFLERPKDWREISYHLLV